MRLAFALFVVPASVLVACYSPPQEQLTPRLDGNYIIDPAHTSLVWHVSHVGLSHYTGRFDRITGSLQFDGEHPEKSRLEVKIDPTSLSTVNPEFDKKIILGRGWLNAEQWPDIRFVSTHIQKTDETHGTVTGDLSFRGQTHAVTLNVGFNGAGKSFSHKGDTLGFSATGSLLRSDFGLTKFLNFGIGDQVYFEIESEFNVK